jgi:hypothetical protein
MKEVVIMTYKKLVLRFRELGIDVEYKMGIDGKGYYLDGNLYCKSFECIEEKLLELEEKAKEQE